MPTREDEQALVAPTIVAPIKMLDFRLPAMALDLRYASNCRNVTVENGILKKRTGFSAFSVDDAGNTNIPGKVQGLCQSPFGWTDDLVALSQNATNTAYYLYDTSDSNWDSAESEAQTAYSQLTWCPAVKSDGTEVVILCDNKARIKIWDDSQSTIAATIANHTTNSTVLRAKVIRYVRDHLTLFNVGTYAGSWTQEERKIQWMSGADIEDDDGGDYGSNYLLGRRGGKIVGAEMLAHDCVIYCEHQIIKQVYIGGTSVFRFDELVHDVGLAAQNAIADLGNRHLFLADDLTVREYTGGTSCRAIGDPIDKDLYNSIYKTKRENSFFVVNKGLKEAWLFIPTTSSGVPDLVYVCKYGGTLDEYVWYKDSKTGLCGISYDNFYALIGRTGAIDDYNNLAATKDDGASPIDGYWDSISIRAKNPAEHTRHNLLHFEAKGDAVTTYYSTDEGGSWTEIEAHTLTSSWAHYTAHFDTGQVRSVIYRFRNITSDETFEIKWWQPVGMPSGER